MIINKKDLQPGDLIFYSHEDNGQFQNISHVAIYVVMERWFMRRNQREVWYQIHLERVAWVSMRDRTGNENNSRMCDFYVIQ